MLPIPPAFLACTTAVGAAVVPGTVVVAGTTTVGAAVVPGTVVVAGTTAVGAGVVPGTVVVAGTAVVAGTEASLGPDGGKVPLSGFAWRNVAPNVSEAASFWGENSSEIIQYDTSLSFPQ